MSLVKSPSCREPRAAVPQLLPGALPLQLSSQLPEMLSTVLRAPLPSSLVSGSRGPVVPMVTRVPSLSPSLLCQGPAAAGPRCPGAPVGATPGSPARTSPKKSAFDST